MEDFFSTSFFEPRVRVHPDDSIRYFVHREVIGFTRNILKSYGRGSDPQEGVVYWSGHVEGNYSFITSGYAPETAASRYGFRVLHDSNRCFVEHLSEHDLIYLCQVHSHPSTWVDHSLVDDKETAFRGEGLVSIVVPSFGKKGVLPFRKCGIHRFSNGEFLRLSDEYVDSHFKPTDILTYPILTKDARYDKLAR